jgi:hypothetical protein
MAPVCGYFTKNSLRVPDEGQRLEEWWLELRKKEWEAVGGTNIRYFYDLTEHTSTKCSSSMSTSLLHEALQYFRLPNDITRIASYLKKPTRSNLTALPPEIQLMILEILSLSEMDTSIRNHFPHLIDLWLPIAPLRVTQWFTHLCFPKNLRDEEEGVESAGYIDSKTWITTRDSTLLSCIISTRTRNKRLSHRTGSSCDI